MSANWTESAGSDTADGSGSQRQERQVFGWINGNNPMQYGLDFGLWTRQIVRELVQREFSSR